MKKHVDTKRGDPLTVTEVRLVRLLDRLIRRLGRGPTVSQVEEVWNGSRSGIIEGAHSCREKGALTWSGVSWKNMSVTPEFFKKYPSDNDDDVKPTKRGIF